MPESAKVAFPTASKEFLESASCFALGKNTACVFHSMRALEICLGSLAECLGVESENENWQNIIDQIEKKIRKKSETLPKGTEKARHMQFLSEAAVDFRYFKDAWRNHVSHNKKDYDEEDSKKVLEHVKSFIIALSHELKEQDSICAV